MPLTEVGKAVWEEWALVSRLGIVLDTFRCLLNTVTIRIPEIVNRQLVCTHVIISEAS